MADKNDIQQSLQVDLYNLNNLYLRSSNSKISQYLGDFVTVGTSTPLAMYYYKAIDK